MNAAPDAQPKPNDPALVLGFDYGSKRVGLAVGNRTTGTCRALGHLPSPAAEPQWQPFAQAVNDWQPDALLVGLPLNLDGSRQPMTRKARHFAQQLRQRFALPVREIDERLSSCAAEAELVQARRQGGKGRLKRGDSDAVAAAVIVQQWLDQT